MIFRITLHEAADVIPKVAFWSEFQDKKRTHAKRFSQMQNGILSILRIMLLSKLPRFSCLKARF